MKKIVLALALFLITAPAFAADTPESSYERVMRTGTIRCGYGLWAPHLMRDPNTGVFSGIFYEYVEALGRAMNLKIEWTEEVPFGTHIEALQSNRFDAWCFDWPDAARGKFVDYTQPAYYIAIHAYVRKGDVRFDDHIENIETLPAKIAIIDGERSSLIANEQFSKAEQVALPQLSDPVLMLMNVATGKADITFTDAYTGRKFMEDNPGKIQPVRLAAPIQVIPNTLSLRKGQDALRQTLDSATNQLLNDGVIERLLKKYEGYPGVFLRVAKPYEMSK